MNYCAYCGLFFFNLTERDKQFIYVWVLVQLE